MSPAREKKQLEKILHVVPTLDPSRGGPSRSVLGLATSLAQGNHDVTLVTGGDPVPADTNTSLKVVRAPHLPLPFEIPGSKLLHLLEREISTSDIVHLHSIWNGSISVASRLARKHKKVTVLSPRGMLDSHNMKHHAHLKKLARLLIEDKNLANISAFHFLDETEYDGCSWLKSSRTKPKIIQPNGIDINSLNQRLRSAHKNRNRTSDREEMFDLVFMGRLNSIKGLELQIELLARLSNLNLPIRLHWIGPDDGELKKLTRYANSLGVDHLLHIHGPVYSDERLVWLQEADAVLLTSHYEANSMTAQETMAVGGVLLATDTCHLEVPAQSDAVITVPRGLEHLTDAALQLINSSAPEERALRERARDYAVQHLDWNALATQMISFYEQIFMEFECAE